MIEKNNKPFTRIQNWLSSSTILYYVTIWLIVLLVFGTLAQRDMGLYAAQEKYFSSWWLWVSLVPLPGTRLILTIIFFNLLSQLLSNSAFTLKNCGVVLAHLGVLCMLLGAFITAYTTKEGAMLIPEGHSSNYIEDYHKLELALINRSPADYDEVIVFSNAYLKAGALIQDQGIPGKITVIDWFRNCRLVKRRQSTPNHYKGIAKQFVLQAIPLNPKSTQNRAGIVIEVESLDHNQNGIYIIHEMMPMPPSFSMGENRYQLILRHKRYHLPFYIELIDFKKELYPGTNKAKSFSSLVNIIDSNLKRKALIEMNRPLRNKGYTFYQAAFIETATEENTVLAVVQNSGRYFPYISSIIICVGLLLHLSVQRLSRQSSQQS